MSSILEQSAQWNERMVYNRLKEICPDKDTTIMTFEELVKDCNVAFKIIGYDPKNLEKSVRLFFPNAQGRQYWLCLHSS